MRDRTELSRDRVLAFFGVRGGLALLILFGWIAATANGQDQSKAESPAAASPIHVTHVLGFESLRRNAGGALSIHDDGLQFLRDGTPAAQVRITSIQNISLGEEDRQVGGTPAMVGKAAVPFGGGRVVSLFSHKHYDSFTIEYLDSNGGFHGAIFRVPKGRALPFKNELIEHGANKTPTENPAQTQSTAKEPQTAGQQWSVQVARVDPGKTTLAPSFADAIYENLLKELSRSKQFKNVFRSGDRRANDVGGVLVLNTLVEKYTPGSETRRAVTTVSGFTKVNVHIQLLTRDGHMVLERTAEGNVRFIGDNLKATDNVAHKAAQTLKHSTLPEPGAPISPQAPTKEPPSAPPGTVSRLQ